MPHFPCPHCSHDVSVAISQAGSEVSCPGCRQPVVVPRLGDLRRLQAAASDPAVEREGKQSLRSSTDNAGRRALFSGALVIAAIAALAGAFCLSRYLSIEVTSTTEDHIAEVETSYHQVPAAQLVREFQQMEKYNLDVASPFEYKKLQMEKSKWARSGSICLAVFSLATVFGILLGVTDSRSKAARSF